MALPQRRALLIMNMQSDYCMPGSPMYVPGNETLPARISEHVLARREVRDPYDFVFCINDWHVSPGEHFAFPNKKPDYDISWPPHCRSGSPGAALHEGIEKRLIDGTLFKGQVSASLSGFNGVSTWGREVMRLQATLESCDVYQVTIVGTAIEYDIFHTAIEAAQLDFNVEVIYDLCSGFRPERFERAVFDMYDAGVKVRALQKA